MNDGQVKIDLSEVTASADTISGSIDRIKTISDKLSAAISLTEDFWSGESAETIREYAKSCSGSVSSAADALTARAGMMKNALDIYNDAEKANNKNSADLLGGLIS